VVGVERAEPSGWVPTCRKPVVGVERAEPSGWVPTCRKTVVGVERAEPSGWERGGVGNARRRD
jgi:hypothetical protein